MPILTIRLQRSLDNAKVKVRVSLCIVSIPCASKAKAPRSIAILAGRASTTKLFDCLLDISHCRFHHLHIRNEAQVQ